MSKVLCGACGADTDSAFNCIRGCGNKTCKIVKDEWEEAMSYKYRWCKADVESGAMHVCNVQAPYTSGTTRPMQPVQCPECASLRSKVVDMKDQILRQARYADELLECAEQAEARVKELESFIETAEYSELYDALQAIALLGKHGCIVADDCPVCIAKKALKGEK